MLFHADLGRRQQPLRDGEQPGFTIAMPAPVLHAGLVSSQYVTVDDTGAFHSHNPCYATNRPRALGYCYMASEKLMR
ncbi:hypothetical protein ASG42_26545 [Rhizobium sp. Leaf391]|nr:hypothetical protein ASG42_26545 [Rhizobium sp. Leaf391]